MLQALTLRSRSITDMPVRAANAILVADLVLPEQMQHGIDAPSRLSMLMSLRCTFQWTSMDLHESGVLQQAQLLHALVKTEALCSLELDIASHRFLLCRRCGMTSGTIGSAVPPPAMAL